MNILINAMTLPNYVVLSVFETIDEDGKKDYLIMKGYFKDFVKHQVEIGVQNSEKLLQKDIWMNSEFKINCIEWKEIEGICLGDKL